MYAQKREKQLPELRGFVISNGKQIAVWCPYCRQLHMHGWSHLETKLYQHKKNGSHRVAHCSQTLGGENSPFREGGYYIRPLLKKHMEIIRTSLKWWDLGL